MKNVIWILGLFLALPANLRAQAGASPVSPKPAGAGQQASAPMPVAEIKKLQGVLETTSGNIVLEFFPEKAPRHVHHFMGLIKSNYFKGTIFHRIIRNVMIQGGDPLTKDPAKRAVFGTGGLGKMTAEITSTSFLRGTLGAAQYPNNLNSAGSQFFICVVDLPEFNRKYTAWGRVVEGMETVEKISRLPADEAQIAKQRVEILNSYLRSAPGIPFAEAAPEEMKKFRVILETTKGKMEAEFFPEVAPEHTRNFLRLAKAGLFDHTAWNRVMPGYLIQGGDLSSRKPPVAAEQMTKYVKTLKLEPSELKHEKGTLSMAHGESPDSATTSFFIILGEQPGLDGKYTVFGRLVNGMEVLDSLAAVETDTSGTPKERLELIHAEVAEAGK